MSAHFWRVPVSVVKRGSAGSVIQDNGMLQSAATASNGKYLFSEFGAGVKALALIGMHYEVLDRLEKYKKNGGIENRIRELPNIYMGITWYKPGERFKGLFPVHDAATELTKGLVGIASGGVGNAYGGGISGTVNEIGGATADSVDIGRSFFGKLFGKKTPKGPSLTTSEIYIKFHYLQEKGMSKVGKKEVSFSKLIPIIEQSLSAIG